MGHSPMKCEREAGRRAWQELAASCLQHTSMTGLEGSGTMVDSGQHPPSAPLGQTHKETEILERRCLLFMGESRGLVGFLALSSRMGRPGSLHRDGLATPKRDRREDPGAPGPCFNYWGFANLPVDTAGGPQSPAHPLELSPAHRGRHQHGDSVVAGLVTASPGSPETAQAVPVTLPFQREYCYSHKPASLERWVLRHANQTDAEPGHTTRNWQGHSVQRRNAPSQAKQ